MISFFEQAPLRKANLSDLLGAGNRLTLTPLIRVSIEMALRVAKLFNTSPNTSPESWLRMQQAVDLWDVQHKTEKLVGIKPLSGELVATLRFSYAAERAFGGSD